MDVGAALLFPFQWLVSAIMVGLHDGLSAPGMPAASGWTWTLSIIGLVLAIRAALIPVFVKQIKARRRMRPLQPELLKLQDKYTGRTDHLSRQAMAQEQVALYRTHGTNPLSACLPLLIQVPFFFALFTVLSGITTAATSGAGIGAMSHEQVVQFDESSIFAVPLSASLLHGTPGGGDVVTAWAVSAESTAGPFMRQQKAVLSGLPIALGAGGIFFPVGVLIYWTTTNLWTMLQEFVLNPGAPRAAG